MSKRWNIEICASQPMLEEAMLQYREQCTSSVLRLHRVVSLLTQVQDLEEQLRDRIDAHNQALLKKDALERDLEAQQTTAAELEDVVKQLEFQLDTKTTNEKSLQRVSQKGAIHKEKKSYEIASRKMGRGGL